MSPSSPESQSTASDVSPAGVEVRGPFALASAIAAVAALYVHFLIFGEFAFLEVVRVAVPAGALPKVLSALGAGGIVGSVLCAVLLRARIGRWVTLAGFAGCAVSALWAMHLDSVLSAVLAAGLSGLTLGVTTVSLAMCLRPTVHLSRLGLTCGAGTGIAYGICNLPVVFSAPPRIQIALAFFASVAGLIAAVGLASNTHHHSDATDYKPRAIAVWILVFLTLVWLDSAAFYVIQHTEYLKSNTWEGSLALVGNAFVHLLAAVLAGVALDRRRFGPTAITAAVCLVVACLIIAGSARHAALARVLYMTGVSLYSTALVYFPARSGRRWVAAGLYAISGWIGSAIGIGIAENLHRIPAWTVAVAALLLTGAFALRRRARGPEGVGILFGAAVLFVFAAPGSSAGIPDPAPAPEEFGRRVYVDEGCMYCHSQYVRPSTDDVIKWGPAEPLAHRLEEKPPLFGNRRQGPDLSEVGTRRTSEWNEAHLEAPRAISPGSRMPSYAYLFRPGDPRGPALLAYLSSLGRDGWPQRLAIVDRWKPDPAAPVLPPDRQARLFSKVCAQCHGPDGRGDGPAARKLQLKPANLHEPWKRVDPANEAVSLARIAKFGVPGTAMAGHETLTDSEVLSLVAYLETLHRS